MDFRMANLMNALFIPGDGTGSWISVAISSAARTVEPGVDQKLSAF
jgi:hypothetical protein